MNRCERCEPLILDHLYGLLDGPDEAFVEEHLRECEKCAAARDEAARLQGLFARAARGAFPQVRFEAPAATSPMRPTPTQPATPASTLPGASGRGLSVGFWLPWAVAAAVLLAIPGTVIPVLNLMKRAEQARREAGESIDKLPVLTAQVDRARMEIDEPVRTAQRELAVKTQELDRVLRNWLTAEKEKLTQAPSRRSGVEVLKPATLQPGAPNELAIRLGNGPAGATGRLTAEIHEVRGEGAQRTDAVIFSQPLKSNHFEEQRLRLPAETWANLTPQSELFLAVTSEDAKTGAKSEVQERVRLFGPVYATMLVTDKPTYRPGETLFFRSLTLDRMSLRPPEREQLLTYELFERETKRRPIVARESGGTDLVRVADGKVEPVVVNGKPVRGVGCGAFLLPPDLADGDYSLVLRELPHPAGYPPAIPVPVVRPIKVRSSPMDHYEKRTWFSAASYAAGETVNGCAELLFQGKPVAGASVDAVATADNLAYHAIQIQPQTGRDGRVELQFTLPPQLERGDVRLQVTFRTRQGEQVVEEVVTERVPVVGKSVLVEFFPEGGNLVAGVPCQVYFRATTPAGEPVDIRGILTDGRRTLAEIETVTGEVEGANRGIGSFTFTPEIDTPVWVKLTAPAGMHAPIIVPNSRDFPVAAAAAAGAPVAVSGRAGFLLPRVKEEGVAMTVLDPVTAPGQPIRVHLRSVGQARKLVVGAYTRGRLSDTQRVTVEPDTVAEVRLMANANPRGGVVRITVFEEPSDDELRREKPGEAKPDLRPVAERLVFRKPGEALNLSFGVTGGRGPGNAAELDITATDEKGNPAAAVLYAAAVNSGVARGEKDRLLTTHFLIAGEITTPDGLEHADFLLSDNPKAPIVLDLVLATQGWRRFAEQTPPAYARRPTAPTDEYRNLLVTNGQYSVWTDPAAIRDQRKQLETFLPQYEEAKKARDLAQAVLSAAKADRSGAERAQQLAANLDVARAETRALIERADAAAEPVGRFQRAGWYGVAGFGLLALMLAGLCLARPAVRLPLGIGSAGALGLVAFLVFAVGTAEKSQAAIREQALPPAAGGGKEAGAVRAETTPEAIGAGAMAKDKGIDGAPTTELFDATTPKMSGAEPRAGVESVPQQSVEAAKRGKLAAGLPPGTTIPPRVETPRSFGPPSAGGMQKSGGGPPQLAMPAGGAMGGEGFFHRLTEKLQEPPPKPRAPTEAVPAAPAPLVAPLTTAKGGAGFGSAGFGGAGALGAMPKAGRPGPVPQIPLGDRGTLGRTMERHKESDLRSSLPILPAPPGGVPALPVAPPAAGEGRMEFFFRRFGEPTERAQLFAKKRALEVSEQLLQSLSRKLDVSVADLKKALDQARQGTGWVRKGDAKPPVNLSLDEARAYFHIEQAVPRVTPLVVREYAAPRPGVEDEFIETRDTILWQPVVVLPSDGKAKLQFHLGDALGGYQVVVAGHTLDGRIGAIRGIMPITQQQLTTPSARPGPPAPVPPPAP
jgi:hypothetical protein